VSPGRFIPVAEECGLIQSIGRWVINEAFRQNAAWQTTGFDQLDISINLSAAQLADSGLVSMVSEAIERYACDPTHVVLEITELHIPRDRGHDSKLMSGSVPL